MIKRTSGVLMHITSLPSKYGVGTFGKEAYEFVDFLSKAKFGIWQILPLNLTSYGDSPYQSPSNYGYSYYLIDLDTLVEKGLLTKEDLEGVYFGENPRRVNFEALFNNKIPLLKKAFANYKKEEAFTRFLNNNPNTSDFAIFMTLKELNNFKSWKECAVAATASTCWSTISSAVCAVFPASFVASVISLTIFEILPAEIRH